MGEQSLEEKIIRFIAKHSEKESRFVTPRPQWEINSHMVIDYIVEVYGLSKEEAGRWCLEAVNE